jgi:hypothetical protein
VSENPCKSVGTGAPVDASEGVSAVPATSFAGAVGGMSRDEIVHTANDIYRDYLVAMARANRMRAALINVVEMTYEQDTVEYVEGVLRSEVVVA